MEDLEQKIDKHSVGDMLWAKIGNHPFWPCMISYDPYEGDYCRIKKTKRGESKTFHVQYFGIVVQHGWTSPGLILPFEGETLFHNFRLKLMDNASSAVQRKFINQKYNVLPSVLKEWKIAVKEAEEAYRLDVFERYENYVFKYEYDWKKPETSNGKTKRTRITKAKSNKHIKKTREPSAIDEKLCRFCELGSVDLECGGHCMQSYHKACLGLIRTPRDFKCRMCEHGNNSSKRKGSSNSPGKNGIKRRKLQGISGDSAVHVVEPFVKHVNRKGKRQDAGIQVIIPSGSRMNFGISMSNFKEVSSRQLIVKLIDVLNDPSAESDDDVLRFKQSLLRDNEDNEYQVLDDVGESSKEEGETESNKCNPVDDEPSEEEGETKSNESNPVDDGVHESRMDDGSSTHSEGEENAEPDSTTVFEEGTPPPSPVQLIGA